MPRLFSSQIVNGSSDNFASFDSGSDWEVGRTGLWKVNLGWRPRQIPERVDVSIRIVFSDSPDVDVLRIGFQGRGKVAFIEEESEIPLRAGQKLQLKVRNGRPDSVPLRNLILDARPKFDAPNTSRLTELLKILHPEIDFHPIRGNVRVEQADEREGPFIAYWNLLGS